MSQQPSMSPARRSRRSAGPRVRRVVPPAESAVADWFAGADLLDAYAVTLPNDASRDIRDLARAAVERPPAWFRALLGIRDAMVSRIGVKSSGRMRRDAEAGGVPTVGFFPILARSEWELVLGEDDRHLDFRTSVLSRLTPDGTGRELVMTTAVRCHNLQGRLYLRTIAPFHRLIVRNNLRRSSKRKTG